MSLKSPIPSRRPVCSRPFTGRSHATLYRVLRPLSRILACPTTSGRHVVSRQAVRPSSLGAAPQSCTECGGVKELNAHTTGRWVTSRARTTRSRLTQGSRARPLPPCWITVTMGSAVGVVSSCVVCFPVHWTQCERYCQGNYMLTDKGECDGTLPMTTPDTLYRRHRFPGEIISHCVWLYFRFCLSYRDIEELMLVRGVFVTYEAIRQWCQKFGQTFANDLRRRRPRPGDKWHLDEVFVKINGQTYYRWRAVDQAGVVLDILVQPRRDKAASLQKTGGYAAALSSTTSSCSPGYH